MAAGEEECAPSTASSCKPGSKLTFRAPQQPYTYQDFAYGRLLGMGSYSKVVRAKKKDSGAEFALKIMDKKHITKENKVAYVKMERLILDHLDHPGVVRLFFTFQDTHNLYMGLECCHGGELFDQIRRKGRLSLEEARFYAAEIVDVLEYIHGQGLIHRDLKPENLLLTADGHIKVADFGSAKVTTPLQNGLSDAQADDKSCTFVGTAEYVSPEVLNGHPVTIGADLWALGCIIYQMLEGRPPFKGGSEYLTFQKVLAKDLVIPSHFPSAAKELINKLLNLEPDKRPGAGPAGYAALKSHAFFSGIEWLKLRQSAAPGLAPSPSSQGGGNGAESDDSENSDWDLAHLGGRVSRLDVSDASSPMSSSNEPSSPSAVLASAARLLDENVHEPWQKFLFEGETILASSRVRKFRKLSVKKRQLILTDRPRLFYVHPIKLVFKGEVPWSRDIYVRVENDLKFCICTPKRTYNLEDTKGQARVWKESIEKLVNAK
ncbi:hypothetical protein SELMODRAFT_168798 [Selaginella moellendorffii]|uniref:non-specific serine/threonine protein kinase n=1 Tax=Selaginella moellendorffii TaxID=88036 RepID=D8R7N6_SELML|nr:3-phosphoinositide-dependent protein kinase 1 [Selaginella moellendorffii]EFJ31911.1 hypothetical protein SELMODRAFT_168798 [Selaginella moellendorffii]|eukprot:XP_002967312.1 3-phosphoinositide-dependent protein kinase 1 [Selaginella moellendorffii]